MSVIDERGHRILDSIEVPEGYRVELINGNIVVSPSGTPLHWKIQLDLLRQFSLRSGWEVAAEQTIRHPEYSDEPQPDFFALPSETPVDLKGSYPAQHISLVAEVLSKSTRGTDLVDKVDLYARFGIPYYLIVDPFKRLCTLHCFVELGAYTDAVTLDFGRGIHLPEPFGFTLDTSGFPVYE
ncbi:Uma2 family endonuclease [Kitasatospora sp. GAS204B]|uniref:Uma2 family endonuclease n=1 Tax=unclassified Kitasatospora TaxID=2633591 RepID=UPI0024757B41|nr:Uma2 family endonuclease [Kitasatospora sp. GAS204B]MDH6116460.1 Uma2 family endonuclease [Kitasatospora sp. GAS204B]